MSTTLRLVKKVLPVSSRAFSFEITVWYAYQVQLLRETAKKFNCEILLIDQKAEPNKTSFVIGTNYKPVMKLMHQEYLYRLGELNRHPDYKRPALNAMTSEQELEAWNHFISKIKTVKK